MSEKEKEIRGKPAGGGVVSERRCVWVGGVLLIAVWGCGMKKVKDKGEGKKNRAQEGH